MIISYGLEEQERDALPDFFPEGEQLCTSLGSI
jgi:hypothetical protein